MLKKFGIISAIVATMLAITASVPAIATGEVVTTNDEVKVAPTFSQEVSEEQDTARIHFGQSLIFAGSNARVDDETPGLLLAFGNGLTLSSRSEYALVAGNEINFSASTMRDLFVAGNLVHILPEARIGRDVFVAAYRVDLEADLAGSFSATGSQVVLKNVKIAGNVNLSVESVTFEGNVEIAGTLIYNDDAMISGLNQVQAGAIETYTPEIHTQTAADFWLGEITSIVSLFVAALIVFALWPRARAAVTDEHAVSKVAGNLAYGFVFLFAVPFAVILLIMAYVSAPLGIMLTLAYIIMVYLSQAFTGAWLGHLILAKGLKVQFPVYLEALIGILVLNCLALFPGLSFIVGFLSIIFGLGMMIRCFKPHKLEEQTTTKSEQSAKMNQAKKLKEAKAMIRKAKSGVKKSGAKKSGAKKQ